MRRELYRRVLKHYQRLCCLPEQDCVVHSNVVPVQLVEQNVQYEVAWD